MAKTPSPSPPLPAVAHAVLPLCRAHAAHQGLPAAPRDLCEQGTEAARLCAEGFQSFFLSSFSRGNDSVVRSVSKVFRLDHPAAKKSRSRSRDRRHSPPTRCRKDAHHSEQKTGRDYNRGASRQIHSVGSPQSEEARRGGDAPSDCQTVHPFLCEHRPAHCRNNEIGKGEQHSAKAYEAHDYQRERCVKQEVPQSHAHSLGE